MNTMDGGKAMNETMKKHWFKLLITAVVLIVLASMMLRVQGGKEDMPVMGQASDFKLTEPGGKTVGLADHAGKVRLVYFFYSSCPDVCLPTNHILSGVQKELTDAGVFGSDAVMYSITFDPERDTAERLKEYSTALRADPTGWLFLRGGEQQVIDLAKSYKVGVAKAEDGLYIHSNLIILVDRDGNIRKYISAAQADVNPKEIASSIRQLVDEAR
jgi:protein SCO1